MRPLIVLHLPKTLPEAADGSSSSAPPGMVFETCQRRLCFVNDSESIGSPRGQLLRDMEAYVLVLEVVCGLHSRLFGETEVQGQFRAFCRDHHAFSPWGRWLLEDAKAVRARILGDPGAHSYAGVVRGWCGDRARVVVLGTGQLAEEIQRQISRAVLLRSRGLSQVPLCDVVVVAAPIDDALLETLRREAPVRSLWIDLRAERSGFVADLHLDDLFAALEQSSNERRASLPAAQAEIRRLAAQRFATPWCRPWGWEDVAA